MGITGIVKKGLTSIGRAAGRASNAREAVKAAKTATDARATKLLTGPVKPAANLSKPLSGTSTKGLNNNSTTDLIRNKFRKGSPTMPPQPKAAPTKQLVAKPPRTQPRASDANAAKLNARSARRTGAAVLAGTAATAGAVGYGLGKRKGRNSQY